jgi:hypothetical protein
MNMKRVSFALVCALLAVRIGPARAQEAAPELSFPVECEVGHTCMVQNYFDHQPGPGARDYRCGLLSYDGHDGTDIRLPGLSAMAKGVHVVAAADGIVRAVRDGMDDVSLRTIGKAAIGERKAGNSVVVDHPDGWQTQYSHLRKGSVRVKRNDVVKRGQKLGMIGLSGWTEFPHLHFSVRYHGKSVDPFVAPGERARCGVAPKHLWSPAAAAALTYTPTGPLSAGFAGAVPSHDEVKAGDLPKPRAASPVLVFWITAYGVQAGDDEHIRITAPAGEVLAQVRRKIPANKAEWFAYAGRKRRTSAWPAGTYRGEYTLTRQVADRPQTVISTVREIRIGVAGR